MSSTKPTLVAVVIWLLCLACSHEHGEVYQDPYADLDVKVGQQSSEQFEPADKHERCGLTKDALAEGCVIGCWLEWFYAFRLSDNPDERLVAEERRQKIIKDEAWDKETLLAYGIVEDNESVR